MQAGIEPDQGRDAQLVVSCTSSVDVPVAAEAKCMTPRAELSVPPDTVIIVDDDPAVRNSLKFSLEIEGFKARVYASAEELLSTEELAQCSCLVIDQRLSGMSGLDLVAALRGRHVAAPAILITSHPSMALRQWAAKSEVQIVEKPLLGNTLIDKIHEVIGNCRKHS
jgi:FixJ family two-component response regulator